MVRKKVSKNKNSLVVLDCKKTLENLNKEIDEEYKEKIKSIVKSKMIQIRKTERILDMQNKELDNILKGKKQFTEDEILFGEENSF